MVTTDNVSTAWAQAFLAVMKPGTIAPLIVQVDMPEEVPREVENIRTTLDSSLSGGDLYSVHTVANTIFPDSLWNPGKPRKELFGRYAKVWPRVKKCHHNKYGVYFQRMVAFPKYGQPFVNQLDYIISTYRKGNHRHSALQASVYCPLLDATDQQRRGFPCLQQVAFAVNRGALTVTGFYPKQYIYNKAYGNYLGLCRLGQFMAAEMEVSLARMQCLVGQAEVGAANKGNLRGLEARIRAMVTDDERANA